MDRLPPTGKLKHFTLIVHSTLLSLSLMIRSAGVTTCIWACCLIIRGAIPAAIVWLSKPFIDHLTDTIGQNGDPSRTLGYLIVLVSLITLDIVLKILSHYCEKVQAEYVEDEIVRRIHQRSAEVPVAFYDSPEYHDRLFRVQEEGGDRPIAVVEGLGGILQSVIALTGILFVLATHSWWLPLALVGSTIPPLLITFFNRLRAHQLRVETTEDRRRTWYYDALLTTREAASELRFFGLAEHFQKNYRELRLQLRSKYFDLFRKEARGELYAQLLGLLIAGAALSFMVWRSLHGLITIGSLALIYQAFSQAQRIAGNLMTQIGELYSNALYLVDLFAFLKSPKKKDAQYIKRAEIQEALIIRGLSFTYPGQTDQILDNVSATIQQNEIVAIIGENGAGKSTLLKIIAGLYKSDSGTITLGGDLSIFFQEPVRYNDTIENNIHYGEIEVENEEQLLQARESAKLDPLLNTLPEGRDTLLGTTYRGGRELSAGWWRRVALARTLYRNAEIIILDEPTDGMDPWTEKEWYQTLQELKKEKTIMIITHRMSVTSIADRVLQLRDGKLEESSDDLLKVSGD